MSVSIIQVTTEDQWQALKNLLVKLFEYENALRPDRKDFSKNIEGPFSYIQNNIKNKNGAAFIAMDGMKPVGFASGWVVSGDGLDEGDNRIGYLSDAFVLEEYRKQDIYKQMIEARKQHFASLDISRLMVDTLGTNTDMQNILKKTGFSIHKIVYEMKI